MLEALLIMWRESLEAALIVGILLTYLSRSGQRAGIHYVWAGTAAGVTAALVCGVLSNGARTLLSPDVQELLQAGILFVAVGVLTWMVLWMHRHARDMRGELQRKADAALATGRLLGLGVIAFVAVFREGVETVLFMWGIVVQPGTQLAAIPLFVASVGGAMLAVLTAWLFFRGFAWLRLQTFFRVTGVLLLLVASGLLASGVNKLIGLGLVPPLLPQVWNTSWLVREGSPLGAVLCALVGYRSRPSLLEVLSFAAYLPSMLWLLRRADAAASRAASGRDSSRSAA
jgi:high-affinity iron transporter